MTLIQKLCFAFLLGTLSVVTLAAQQATTLEEADLKKEPYLDAETVASLPRLTDVVIQERKGLWCQVKTADGTQGWLRMTKIRLGTSTDQVKEGKSSLETLGSKSLNAITTGRIGATDATATTGAKGLGKEDLKNATPNTQALDQLDNMGVSEEDAKAFAGDKLKSQQIDYMGNPQQQAAPARKEEAE